LDFLYVHFHFLYNFRECKCIVEITQLIFEKKHALGKNRYNGAEIRNLFLVNNQYYTIWFNVWYHEFWIILLYNIETFRSSSPSDLSLYLVIKDYQNYSRIIPLQTYFHPSSDVIEKIRTLVVRHGWYLLEINKFSTTHIIIIECSMNDALVLMIVFNTLIVFKF